MKELLIVEFEKFHVGIIIGRSVIHRRRWWRRRWRRYFYRWWNIWGHVVAIVCCVITVDGDPGD